MSWTITEDNGVLHVRAALDRAEETLTLIERLRERYATFEFKEGKDASDRRDPADEPAPAKG